MYSCHTSREWGTEKHHPKHQRSGKLDIGTNFPPWSLPQAMKESPLMGEAKSQVVDLLQTLDYHLFLPAQGTVKANTMKLAGSWGSWFPPGCVNTEESRQLGSAA